MALTQAQQEFVDRYAPYANLASQQTGLPSRVILAKMALETGYGTRFANNNLPGLQAGNPGQNAGSLGSRSTATWEDRGDGSTYNTNANFLRYATPEESLGGFVNWLTNSRYMNNLSDRAGGGIFDRNPTAEASAVAALGNSGFSTDTNASRGLNTILERLPDLGSYGVASSFTPAINQLATAAPYTGMGWSDVSQGLGPIVSNEYWSRTGWDNSGGNADDTTRYQPTGVLNPYEKGTGISLPSPVMGPTGSGPGFGDTLAGLGNSLLNGATGLYNTLTGQGQGSGGTMSPDAPFPGTDGFGGTNVSGGVGPGSNNLGGATPYGNVDPLAFAGGRNYGGGVGNGQFLPNLTSFGPAPGPYGFTGANTSGGVGNGTVGQLPAGFDPATYMAANPDLAGPLAAMGMSPADHYLRAGAAEGRALMPANYTPTQGPSTTAPTLNTGTTVGTQGPTTTATTLPPGFNEQAYLQNNPDLVTALQGTGVSPAQHYLRFGMQEGRTFGPPGLSPTLDTGTTVPTQGPTGLNPLTPYTGMNTPTLTPDTTTQTQGPGGLTPLSPSTGTTVPTFGGGGKDAPTLGPSLTPTIGSGTTVPTIGPTTVPTLGPGPTQTATDGTLTPAPTTNLGMTGLGGGITNMPSTNVNTLPPGFNEQAYLQANPDLVQPLAAMGVSPSEHYLRFGMQEGRTIGAPGLSPTLDTATTVPTLNTGVTVPTLNTGVTVPTLNTGVTVPTLGPSTTATAWTPGNMSPYGFSGLNPSGFLGAGPQSFGSLYPVGTGGGIASDGGGGAKGGGADMSNPYGFSGMDVSGFNANAGGGGGQGGGGSQASGDGEMTFGAGFDPASAERNYLAYQEMTNNLQRNAGLDPRAIDFNLHNVALGNGGALPANFSPTALSSNVNQANINLAAMTPVVPNLSLTNLQASYGPRNGPSFGIGGFGGIAGFA